MTLAIFVFPVVVCTILALVVLLVVARRLARRDERRARSAVTSATDASLVVLRGKLAVDGKGCPTKVLPKSLRRGRIAAVSSMVSRARLWLRKPEVEETTRALALRLETDDGTVVLEGDVTVTAGSRHVHLGTRAFHGADSISAFRSIALLADGDEVLAVGDLRMDPGNDSTTSTGFREPSATRVLVPARSLRSIQLATTRGARTSLRPRAVLRHPAVWITAALALYPSFQVSKKYDAQKELCGTLVTSTGTGGVGLRSMKEIARGDVFECVARTDAECTKSIACRLNGSCSASAGRCKAEKDEDCAHTTSCLTHGLCTVRGGECIAGRDEDCLRTQNCGYMGYCSAVAGSCKPAKDEDCRASSVCGSLQLCSAVDGQCRIAKDEECKDTDACRQRGECSAVAGACVAGSDTDCQRSTACLEDGLCSAVGGRCIATKDEQCLDRLHVADRKTSASDGACWAETVPCAQSKTCRVLGLCTDRSGRCVAQSDDDCRRSTACKESGHCKRFDDECASSCATTRYCREYGMCTLGADGKCRAEGDDCRQSAICREHAECTAVNGNCRATDDDCQKHPRCLAYGTCSVGDRFCRIRRDEDCRRSRECSMSGRCFVERGRCVAKKDEDCAASLGCRGSNRCFARDGQCERPTDADCRNRPECKRLGRCSSGDYSSCVASHAEDCRASDVCKKYGWCELVSLTSSEQGCFLREPAVTLQ